MYYFNFYVYVLFFVHKIKTSVFCLFFLNLVCSFFLLPPFYILLNPKLQTDLLTVYTYVFI